MNRRSTRRRLLLEGLPGLLALIGACTTFSAARPADVPLGASYHTKAGIAAPHEAAVGWFGDFSDCVLCRKPRIAQSEFGVAWGLRARDGRKYSVGAFLDGLAPQVDLYAQRLEGPVHNMGVGVRAGPASADDWTAKLYVLYDRRHGEDVRLLLAPGAYYYGRFHDPDGEHGASPAWLAGLTQSVGVEYSVGSVTYTPQLTLVAVHGELGGDAAMMGAGVRRLRFDDVFLTAAIGFTFRREEHREP